MQESSRTLEESSVAVLPTRRHHLAIPHVLRRCMWRQWWWCISSSSDEPSIDVDIIGTLALLRCQRPGSYTSRCKPGSGQAHRRRHSIEGHSVGCALVGGVVGGAPPPQRLGSRRNPSPMEATADYGCVHVIVVVGRTGDSGASSPHRGRCPSSSATRASSSMVSVVVSVVVCWQWQPLE
jgi:hypothetical protein